MWNGTEIGISEIQIRKKENWFKELLYKLHILKPKYTKLKPTKSYLKGSDNNE